MDYLDYHEFHFHFVYFTIYKHWHILGTIICHAYIFFYIVSESKQKDLTKRRRWSYLGLSPMTF